MIGSIINLRLENKRQGRKLFILINTSVFHSGSTICRSRGLFTNTKHLFPISCFCFIKYFFSISLKSGRRPLKRWRSVQIPRWYEKTVFCLTEAQTNYRYFQILSDMVIITDNYLPLFHLSGPYIYLCSIHVSAFCLTTVWANNLDSEFRTIIKWALKWEWWIIIVAEHAYGQQVYRTGSVEPWLSSACWTLGSKVCVYTPNLLSRSLILYFPFVQVAFTILHALMHG